VKVTLTTKVKSALFSLAFAALLVPVATAQNAPGAATAPGAAQPSQLSVHQQAYAMAFEGYYYDFQLLADPGQADAFKAAWQHKYDKTGAFNTPAGTKQAIEGLVKVGSLIGCPAQFDGKCLYTRAFRAYMQFHYSPADGNPNLADPADRAKWGPQWEHKFDKTGDFTTQDGTERAIRQMRDSLGQRFDYVFSPDRTKAEQDEMQANFAGIGAPVSISNIDKIPLGGPLQLLIHDPEPGSPAYGLVHYGDIIVKIDGNPVDGMGMAAATKKFVGAAGTHMTITVQRKDDQGVTQLVDVPLTRNYTVDELSPLPAKGDTTPGVPMEITNREDIKLAKGFEMVAHAPEPDAPAFGKVKEGDLIVKVDGKDLTGLTLKQAVALVRGPVGSTVTLSVLRAGQPVDIQIKRDTVEEHAVYFKALPDNISYIDLEQFSAQNVPDDMMSALSRAVLPLAGKALASKGDAASLSTAAQFDSLAKSLEQGDGLDDTTLEIALNAVKVYEDIGQGGGIVLDLRGNPGGSVEVLRALASMMLPQGSLLVKQERTAGSDEIVTHEDTLLSNFEVLSAHRNDPKVILGRMEVNETERVPLLLPSNMPLTVLVDGYSASAAELLSGMLQINHRAVIIGKSTLGKGVGQALINLPYGMSLHVTTFEFFPGGMKSDWRGVIVNQDVNPADDGKTDPQLDAAVAQVKLELKTQADRATAVDTALALHHRYFGNEIQGRADQDNKPVGTQDPSKKQ